MAAPSEVIMRSPANSLLSPIIVGGQRWANRVILAPLTRARCLNPARIPDDLLLEYYVQRASAGLVITEAVPISEKNYGWQNVPGIYNAEQAAGWKRIVDAVHAKGGLIYIQFWHMGRQQHSSQGDYPVAPSPIACDGVVSTVTGDKAPAEVPHELTIEEIADIVQDFKTAAQYAKDAGFDGIELHGANGYLIDQFIQSCSNQRQDKYGGSFENRYRFVDEVIDAIAEVYPTDRIAVRVSPNSSYASMGSEDNAAFFIYYAQQLSKKNIAYLHVIDGLSFGGHTKGRYLTLADFRKAFDGVIIANGGIEQGSGDGLIRSGAADACAFGRLYISNPDLPERFAKKLPLNASPEYPTWWTSSLGAEGYTTFPVHESNL